MLFSVGIVFLSRREFQFSRDFLPLIDFYLPLSPVFHRPQPFTAGVFYVLYHPQLPSFSVDSLRLSDLNLTSSNLLTSRLNLAVTTQNPNRKVVFLYNDVAISAYADEVQIGKGSFPAFVHGTKSTTVLKATVSSSGWSLEPEEATDLRKAVVMKQLCGR